MSATQTEAPATRCRANIHDGSLPSNSTQIRQCRNHAVCGSKWCATHFYGISGTRRWTEADPAEIAVLAQITPMQVSNILRAGEGVR